MSRQSLVLLTEACVWALGLWLAGAGEGKREWRPLFDGKDFAGWQNGQGKAPGPGFYNPWALAIDSKGRVHVLDTENHRVQRIAF